MVFLRPITLQWRHVEDSNGLADAFQRHFAELFERYRAFDRRCDASTYQDLPILGLTGEPRREIRDRPDRGIVHTLGKADLAKGGVTLRNADAKANVVPVVAPDFDPLSFAKCGDCRQWS